MVNVIAEIGKKELRTTFGSKSIILPMLFVIGMCLFTLVPQLPTAFTEAGMGGVYLILLMFLIMPTAITSFVGVNAFPNEIKWKTMKSLLVAPVSEKEIFIGKSLACIIAGLIVEACLSAIILVFLPVVDIPILIILLAIGPLLVIFATFLIIAATSRFPSSAEGGTAAFIPVGGVIGIFLLCFFLQKLLQMSPTLTNTTIALIVAALTLATYFIATKWFDRERLIAGL